MTIEALPGRVVEGNIDTVATMPLSDQRSETANGIAYFVGRIKLRNMPPGLRPDMTTEVPFYAVTARTCSPSLPGQ